MVSSAMVLVSGMDADCDATTPLRKRTRAERFPDGTRRYSPLIGLSLLTFFDIACRCSSALAVVPSQTRSHKWPAFHIAYTVVLAWLMSLTIDQPGRILELG